MVILSGEAGIGKSRLVGAEDRWLICPYPAGMSQLPYYPNSARTLSLTYSIACCKRRRIAQSPAELETRLELLLAPSRLGPVRWCPLWHPTVLTLPADRYGPLTLSPGGATKTLEALVDLVLEQAEQQRCCSFWKTCTGPT